MDINNRLPNNLNSNQRKEVYDQLSSLGELITNKHIEITTIAIVQFLENYYNNFDILLEVEFDSDYKQYYWRSSIKLVSEDVIDNFDDEWQRGQQITDLIGIPDDCQEMFYSKGQINFINNEVGRDTLLQYMLRDKWKDWKKEGEVIENYEKLSSNIPNKETIIKPKMKI